MDFDMPEPRDPRSGPIVSRYTSPGGFAVTVRDISHLDRQESWAPGRPIPQTFLEKLLRMPVRREDREWILPFDGWRYITLESSDHICSTRTRGEHENEAVSELERILEAGGGEPKA